jgi:hypothetical protein
VKYYRIECFLPNGLKIMKILTNILGIITINKR